MTSTRLAGPLIATLALAAPLAHADLFHASGGTITSMNVKKAAGKDCVLPAGTSFDMAPNPASSASSPTVLISTRKKPESGDCPENEKLTVSTNELDSSSKYQEWTIGAAVVPFKYYATGTKGVASNTAAIGYVGYKVHSGNGDVIFGFGGGPTTISVPAATSSSGAAQTTTQVTGASVALLFLGQLGYGSTAQFGLAVGKDKVSNSANWSNNGKTWIGFQIGAKIY